MCGRYTLEWLDSLITVSLNPAKTDLNTLSDEEIRSIISKIFEEKERLLTILKHQLFSLTKEKQIAFLVNQSHSSLIILLDQVLKYPKTKRASLNELYNTLISSLEELLSFVEVRFFTYLSLKERVPVTYLAVAGKELKQRADKLKVQLLGKVSDRELVDIVLSSLYAFTNRLKQDFPVTFQELLYLKDLLKELELLEATQRKNCVFTTLDELLILLNFNSKPYMRYLTNRLAEKINANENTSDKLERLLFYYKQFNQMHRKPGVILNPQYGDLKTELGNWFTQEMFYLEKQMHHSIIPLKASAVTEVGKDKEKQKVLSILSVDQMALVLRAADELRIITARSLNSVFKSIVPHLSTPYQENISYDSMRSKSYSAERRDKEIVIQTLQQMINKIKEY